MRRIKTRLISLLLAFIMLLGCGITSLADDLTASDLKEMSSATEIGEGDHLVQLGSSGRKWFRFTPSASAFYSIEETGRYYECNTGVYLYDSDGRYLGYRDCGGEQYDYFNLIYYLEAGHAYYFYCVVERLSSGEYPDQIDLSISPNRSEFIVCGEWGGHKTYYGDECNRMELHPDAGCETVFTVFPNNSSDGDTYTYSWAVVPENSYISESTGNETNSVTVAPGVREDGSVWVKKNGRSLGRFDYHTRPENHLVIPHNVVNVLTAPGTDTPVTFPAVNCIDMESVLYYYNQWGSEYGPDDGAVSAVYTYPGRQDTSIDRFLAADTYGNAEPGYVLLFVDHSDNTMSITEGATVDIELPFVSGPADGVLPCADCMICLFTPEVSGTYQVTSSDIQRGNPYVALFDGDGNCIGYNDDPEHEEPYNLWGIDDEYMLYDPVASEGQVDQGWNFTLTRHLEAGKTYRIVVWSTMLASPWYQPATYDYMARFKMSLNCIEPDPVPGTPSDPGSGSGTGGSGNHGSNTTPVPSTPTPSIPASASQTVTETGVAGFVERLYTVALGRRSDPAGKQDWIDAITLRGETGASCARGFLYSPEFLNKGVSNEEFVATLYRTFFNREPDQAGFNAWVGVLNNGTPKEEVIEGFINSTEWANLCLFYGIRSGGTGAPSVEMEPNQATIDFATRLYTTCLNRAADQNGLMAWARQLANQRDTGTGAARGFFFSSEFTGQNVSNGEYVARLYRTFMNREPDQAGYDAWVGQLDSGVSREEVFDGFSQSVEFSRICASYGIVR